MEENTFFLDTMQGLLEAIAIDKGVIQMESVPGMPAETLRVAGTEETSSAVSDNTSSAVTV